VLRLVTGAPSDGKNALAAIEENDFDLIVLDLAMPDMDGFEFLKTVRVKSPKLIIVVIFGFLGGTMLAAAKLFGAAATLAKPFSPVGRLTRSHAVRRGRPCAVPGLGKLPPAFVTCAMSQRHSIPKQAHFWKDTTFSPSPMAVPTSLKMPSRSAPIAIGRCTF
jgi:CheY-like chemotaxis protein